MIITTSTETLYNLMGLTQDDVRIMRLALARFATGLACGDADRAQATRLGEQIRESRNA